MFRFLRRTRPVPAEPALAVIDITAFPDQHNVACANVAAVSLPLGPLITEMIALHTHTRHLAWLSEREDRPEAYQLLARSIVAQVLAGWRHQTGGRGTIEDLLADGPHSSQVRAQESDPSDFGPISSGPDHAGPELAQSAPRQGAVPWWSQTRGQQ